MNLHMNHDRLIHRIKEQSSRAQEAKQVAKRLRDLLPQRLRELRYQLDGSGSPNLRRALAHPSYETYVSEYIDITDQARTARIEYETHLMLMQARQSVRRFRL